MSQNPNNNEFGSGNLYNFGFPNTPGSSSNSPQNVRGTRPIGNVTPQNLFNEFNNPAFFSQFLQQQQQNQQLQQNQQFHQQFSQQYPQQYTQQYPSQFSQFNQPGMIPFNVPNTQSWSQSQPTFTPLNNEEVDDIRGGSQEQQVRVRSSHKRKGKEVAKEQQHKKLWTPPEEIWLASCWIDCSEDGVHGNSQKGTAFWGRVRSKFNNNDDGFLRNDDQLSGKWRHMDKACKDFTALYNEEERNPRRSGRNEEDVYNVSVLRYQERNAKPWAYKEVWEFLKNKPKWYTPPPISGSGVRRRRGPQLQLQDEDDVVGDSQTVNLGEDRNLQQLFGNDALERPMGRERSKKAARKSGSSDAGTSSRGTTSSKSSRFDELASQWSDKKDQELERRNNMMDAIVEEERKRTAMEVIKLFKLNLDEIADPKERKSALKFKKKMAKEYKEYIDISSDDE